MISFCTTSMNRLIHLRETLPSNMEVMKGRDVEFIVLNYSSNDGIDEWVRDNFSHEINQGFLKYYSLTGQKYFVATHAKNIAHKLGSGDILCNVDADCHLLPGFYENLTSIFSDRDVIAVSETVDRDGNAGSCGKIAVRREHFYNVNGYDESIYLGWGCEDTNFQYRCRMHNNLKMVHFDQQYNLVIPHDNDIRVANFQLKDINASLEICWNGLHHIKVKKEYVANRHIPWGQAVVLRNFTEEISL